MRSLASIPEFDADPHEQTQRKQYKNVKLPPKTKTHKKKFNTKNQNHTQVNLNATSGLNSRI